MEGGRDAQHGNRTEVKYSESRIQTQSIAYILDGLSFFK